MTTEEIMAEDQKRHEEYLREVEQAAAQPQVAREHFVTGMSTVQVQAVPTVKGMFDHYFPNGSPQRKLGKRAPRLDRRTLSLSKYITPALQPPPEKAGYIERVKRWPMYGNDTLGDCVIAGAGHMIQEMTAYSDKEVQVSEDSILKGYEHVGGYVPGDPSTDNGCVMLDALKYWRNTGFDGHNIFGFVSVNPYDKVEVMHAIHLFGSVFIGIALPLSAQDARNRVPGSKPCWQVPPGGPVNDGSPGSWGGHAVPLIGYSDDPNGTPGLIGVSWGQLYDVTWNFLRAYVDEMWIVLSMDWFNAVSKKTPTGLSLEELAADIEFVRRMPSGSFAWAK